MPKYVKQLAYESQIRTPKGTANLTQNAFDDMATKFRLFQEKGISVPVTTKHGTVTLDQTLGYVTNVFSGKDAKNRPSLFCEIDFNEEPDRNVLNAGISLETEIMYQVPTTGEFIAHPLTQAVVTPTPVINDMAPFSLAFSLDSALFNTDGKAEMTAAKSKESAMNEVLTQLKALVAEQFGLDPAEYEGKDAELLEFIAKMFTELQQLRKQTEGNTVDVIPEDEPKEESKEDEPEKEPENPISESEQIEDLKLELSKLRREKRKSELEQLMKDGYFTPKAYQKAQAMYAGNLQLSRDAEYNDFIQMMKANKPVLNTESLSGLQKLEKEAKSVWEQV
jgi:hypothetical protein